MSFISKSIFCCSPFLLALGLSTAMPNSQLQAQSPATVAHFVAELAQAPEKARFVAGGVVWRCADTQCTASRSPARPLRICRELKREAGQITKFMIMGEELAEDKMARCNR